MKKFLSLAALALVVAACSEQPTAPQQGPQFDLGNGYPMGGHDYQLTLIGVPKDKTATMDNNSGARIFVQLNSPSSQEVTNPGGKNNQFLKDGVSNQNQIYLCNSTNGQNDVNDARCDAWRTDHADDFGVIDANATDGDGAIFGIPDPCVDADPLTDCTPRYRIFARAITPGGSVTITTCADEYDSVAGDGDPWFDAQDDVWCGANGVTLSKQTAFKAIEVTNNLTQMTLYIDDTLDPELAACIGGQQATDGDGDWYTIDLFDNCFQNYFWNYDNNGQKIVQLRFFWADRF